LTCENQRRYAEECGPRQKKFRKMSQTHEMWPLLTV
jgi:hypothetical protein